MSTIHQSFEQRLQAIVDHRLPDYQEAFFEPLLLELNELERRLLAELLASGTPLRAVENASLALRRIEGLRVHCTKAMNDARQNPLAGF